MAWRPDSRPSTAAARTRAAFFPEAGGFVETAVIAEGNLTDGAWCEGPALIEQAGATIVAGPGDRFAMDRDGNIRLNLGGD